MSLLRPNYIHCALVLSLVAVFGLYYYWCDPLWKLSGQMVPLLDLESRGFTIKPWGELPSQLLRRVPKLEEARAKIGYNVSKASLDADVFSRGRFQSLQVQRFCSASNISPLLPLNPLELKELFKHLLYDDSKRLVFCYVPKNGCSNIKRMMLVLDGVLPPESVNGSRPNEQILDQVKALSDLSASEALHRLQNYYKAVIVRDPLIRALSAYRNKIEKPLDYKNRRPVEQYTKQHILYLYRSEQFVQWMRGEQLTSIHPSFGEYIRWLNEYPDFLYNEHFRPVLELCRPCAIRYDFYANFIALDYDLYALMHYLDIPASTYPHVISHWTYSTSDFLDKYYGQLTSTEQEMMHRRLDLEMKFYYALYPEEDKQKEH